MSLAKIDKFIREVKTDKRIDTHAWKEFNLVDVFPDYDHGQRLTKADRISGDLPLVTAGQFNNGIAQYVKSNPRNIVFENCVTIDMFGNCFYQEGKFVCDDNVYPIKNIKNKYVGLFLASVFQKNINFDFKKQFRLKHLVNVKIKLPVNKKQEPDWKYMEKYISKVFKQVKTGIAA